MKPLHVAKSLSDLENMCILRDSSSSHRKVADLILRLFEEAAMLQHDDEEKAFILYGRGLNLFAGIEAGGSFVIPRELRLQCECAKDTFSRLRRSLRMRYEMAQKVLTLDDLPVCDDPIFIESLETKPKQFPGRWMPPIWLYEAIVKGEKAFLIDVRSADEYSTKKIVKIPQINIGGQIIHGQTMSQLEKRMDDVQRNQWNLHKSAKVIILLDRDSGGELIKKSDAAETFPLQRRHPLKIMYDALVTYNAEKTALPPAVFLSGGLKEFEKRYPSYVSSTPCSSSSSIISKSSDQIGYPTVSANFGSTSPTELSYNANSCLEPKDQESTKPLPYSELTKLLKPNGSLGVSKSSNEQNSRPQTIGAGKAPHEPTVDRSTKPQLNVSTESPTGRLTGKLFSNFYSSHDHIQIDRSKKPQTVAEIGGSKAASSRLSKPNLPAIPLRVLRRGLQNLGNTCYMNSTLQCLLHTPQLWYFFMAQQPFQGHLAQSFAEFICEMSQSSSLETYSPKVLKERFDRSHSMFADGQQQDSHEFLMIFLDSLHEELNRSEGRPGENKAKSEDVSANYLADLSWRRNRARDDSVILDWFNSAPCITLAIQGQLLSTVQCLTCKRSSHAFDEFMYLSVSIQGSDSTDLVTLHLSNSFIYPKYVRVLEVYTLVINSCVQFPLTGLKLLDFIRNPDASDDCTYDLYGVINHHGSVQSGHYTAYCLDSTDHRWRNFDDSRVTELSDSEIVTRAAYVLFYKRSRVVKKTA
ncbi:unnamed protein product [Hydatigera taeniaeformis]|uniref:Ubiquitin carboxyl-terminal hydrolase n=1 Tax=Hydatigena taeniaeformis TaxID=6205 RepID=A0A0R3WMI6_HYDTA|nr:unnamed protein product [Hydatigera taeniaeformis]